MNKDMLNEKTREALHHCRLFNTIPEDAYPEVLRYLHSRSKHYKKGELIITIGAPFPHACFILSGQLKGTFLNEAFDEVNIDIFPRYRLVGESFACIRGSQSPLQLSAMQESEILFLDLQPILSHEPGCAHTMALNSNLLLSLASQNTFLNKKVQILSQRSMRDRIRVYLRTRRPNPDGTLTIPYSRTAMAEFLNVNRSAMTRELQHLQKEGVLAIDGRKIRVLDPGFL